MKRIASVCVAAASLASVTLAGAAPAEAGWRGGPAFALGAVGGLALGSAIAAGARPAYGYAPAPAYGYTPVYGGYAPAYGPDCYTVRRRMVDEFGDVYIRRVRVCD
ncbi:hypothetical protein SAMN02799631_04967 [Methylobacterium sp. 174MFSha1.1]|uniref:hypothetical protein n=1 Tax=Methylobacterium sp. 174MFSha1.1 TaxID=1502749 RepID=UPI0008EB0330|nr:hypothetical protein [Methylobacterium sp. 174MFSha1.1]SFV09853.1 hypothetical protein SAMN02799631_04967 [Methylobacterium sp. 174MFSha1.1]